MYLSLPYLRFNLSICALSLLLIPLQCPVRRMTTVPPYLPMLVVNLALVPAKSAAELLPSILYYRAFLLVLVQPQV